MKNTYPIFDQHTQRLFQEYDPNLDETQEIIPVSDWQADELRRVASELARLHKRVDELERYARSLEGDGR